MASNLFDGLPDSALDADHAVTVLFAASEDDSTELAIPRAASPSAPGCMSCPINGMPFSALIVLSMFISVLVDRFVFFRNGGSSFISFCLKTISAPVLPYLSVFS